MKEIFVDADFDVEEITSKINNLMSKWSIQLLDINGPNWIVFDYEMEIKYVFIFDVDFNDLETYCKNNNLQDLLLDWDYDKNISITMQEVSNGSDKKVWWKCNIC